MRAGAVSDESLLAGKLHHHFAGAGTGEKRSDDFEIQRFNAGTKTPTDERLDHANTRGIHFKASGQHEMQVVADLRHSLHGQAAGQRIKFGKTCVRLDLCVIDLSATECLLTHQISFGKSLVDIAELMMDFAFDVAGFVVMQKHGTRRASGI